jgi:hypothetical protein
MALGTKTVSINIALRYFFGYAMTFRAIDQLFGKSYVIGIHDRDDELSNSNFVMTSEAKIFPF